MLCLYFDALINGHTLCSVFIILNEIALQKVCQYSMTIIIVGPKHVKTQKQQDKNMCHTRDSNPGCLTPQSGALPLCHQYNKMYQLQSSYLIDVKFCIVK